MKSKKCPPADLENIMPLLISTWRKFRKEAGPSDKLQTREFRSVVAAVSKIQQGLGSDMSFIGQDYFADPELLGAYLLYQWVVHYQQGLSLINELPITPRRVLDVCSGPAAFAFAALKHGASEVYATDQSLHALDLGATVCGKYGFPITTRKWHSTKNPLPITGQFDLIILGHCLEELFPANKPQSTFFQDQFINYLLEKLTPQGYLLIAESSFVEANKRILMLRDNLVSKGVPVQAPCIWRGECPALKVKDSPCYAQREFEKPTLIKEIQRAARINLSSLKMSYIIFRNPKADWPQLPDKPLYRVISPPVDTYQGKRFYLCGTDGKKTFGSHLTEHPPESRAFEYLRRGELISIENGLDKAMAIDIVKDTKIVVEAACGKALEEDYQQGE
jgi:SAM-dependent methyltransferase